MKQRLIFSITKAHQKTEVSKPTCSKGRLFASHDIHNNNYQNTKM